MIGLFRELRRAVSVILQLPKQWQENAQRHEDTISELQSLKAVLCRLEDRQERLEANQKQNNVERPPSGRGKRINPIATTPNVPPPTTASRSDTGTMIAIGL